MSMGVTACVVGGAGIVGSVATGIMAQNSANGMRRASAAERARLDAEIAAFERSRQAVINPYANYKDVSGLAKDLSSMVGNPYANLSVATNAAKYEAEQVDLSLANTLDTLRETGASAGGATALAQAALKSKQGISANIEQQEAQNEKLRAQGEQQMQQLKMAEAQRIQSLQISEAQRMQQAEAAGKQFMWQSQEDRDKAKLDRLAGLSDFAANQQAQASMDSTAAMTGMIGGITSSLGSAATAYGMGQMYAPPKPASDRRLKKNIKLVGKSPSGLNIYTFEYIDTKFGNGVFKGIMSDEIPLEAVIKGADGYDRVNYALLDVKFEKIN